jgi:hypothetical protein
MQVCPFDERLASYIPQIQNSAFASKTLSLNARIVAVTSIPYSAQPWELKDKTTVPKR